MAGTHGVTTTTDTLLSQLMAKEGAVLKIATIASGNDLERGAVLERSSQKMTEISTPANARAVLAEDCDASAADVQAQIIVFGHLKYSDLQWPTMSAANKKTAVEALEDAGISVDIDHTTIEATS